MKSIYKKILSVGLIGALVDFVPMHQAQAVGLGSLFSLTGITSTVVTFFSQVILGLLLLITQGFFMVTGFFIELAMKLNNNILDPTTNKFLFTGWTVFVNVADLALVVSLIIIAFATMLNYESYGMQKALPKLIVVALLVNFSLVIPGVLVDLSGMVTAFFVKEAGLTGTNISSALAAAMNVSGFLDVSQLKEGATLGTDLGAATATFGFGVMRTILNMVFIIVFTAIATIILATFAIMLFLRYFMLSFLLLMTPLIFVSWIFPATKSHWDKWWNDFMRWTMFPPVLVFFMWLSLTALNSSRVPEKTTTGSAGDAVQNLMNFQLSSLINMAMAVMLMMLSLVAANSISIKGAKGGKDMIGTMTNWGRGRIDKLGAYGKREGERGARRLGARPVAAVGRGAVAMRKYEGAKGGLVGMAAGAVGRAGGRLEKNQQEALKKAYKDKFGKYSADDIASRWTTMGTDERMIAAPDLAKAGKMSKVNQDILDKDIASESVKKAFEAYGGPDAFKDFTKTAGRNAEMVKLKQEADKTGTDEDKKKYAAAAKKFYKDEFKKKDYEGLAKNGYFEPKNLKEGKYNKDAMAAMLMNEPGAFGSAAGKIGKREDMKAFLSEVEKIRHGIIEEIGAALKPEQNVAMAKEVHNELLDVMRELKIPDEVIEGARQQADIKKILQTIAQKDQKVAQGIGDLADYEGQMKLLYSRKNSTFAQMDGYQDYQHMIRVQETLRKSAAKRMYEESEKEEKKEEKKA